MIIINPKVELIEQEDEKRHACKCARICYGKESGNDDKLYDNLIKNKHWSVFRHVTYYAIVPINSDIVPNIIQQIHEYPYQTIGMDVHKDRNSYYIVYNGNFALDYPAMHNMLSSFLVSPKEFSNASGIAWLMMRYTFKITTQISTSRELNRTSPNSITEMSTRWVDLERNTAICRPHWMSEQKANAFNIDNVDAIDEDTWQYLQHCRDAFSTYKYLIDYGFKREDARGVLPLDTATQVIYTYNIEEWKHIIKLRSNHRSHPNAQIIANMIKKKLEELGYEFKD